LQKYFPEIDQKMMLDVGSLMDLMNPKLISINAVGVEIFLSIEEILNFDLLII
jgi:hypothetical protein